MVLSRIQNLLVGRRRKRESPESLRVTPRSLDGPTVAFLLAGAGIVLLGAFLVAYRISTAADVFVDEMLYFKLGNNLAMHGTLSEGGKPFYLHPPLYFLVEAFYLRLTGFSSGDIFAGVYHARYLSVFFHAITAGVLILFGARLYGRKVGLTLGVLFVADSFVNRINRRNMLETLAMLLLVATLWVLFEDIKRNRTWTLWLSGILLGLAFLTKELIFPLALVIMVIVAFRCNEANRTRFLSIFAIGLAIYAVYPLWAWAGGGLGALVDAKWYQIGRFGGFNQDTGWNRQGVSFLGALSDRLQAYGATYVLIGIAGPLAIFLWFQPGLSDRFIGSWTLATYLFFSFDVVRGLNNDQFFYYLVIPPLVVVARSLWLGLAGPCEVALAISSEGSRLRASRSHRGGHGLQFVPLDR